MTGWHAAHLVTLGAWGGLVLGELVMELAGRRDPGLRQAVFRLHRWIDVLVEAPLLAAVVLTGAALLRATEPDARLWIKVGCGLGTVAANALCVVAVVRRDAAADQPRRAASLTRWVFRSAALGAPLAIVALALGGRRAGWW